MKKIATALALATLLFSACKKDNEPTTAQKIQAKWTFVNTVEKDFTVNPPTTATFSFPGIFFEFRGDGKVYLSGSQGADTTTYSILSNNYILLDGDSNQIVTLNANALVLRSVDRAPNGSVSYEYTQNLSK